MGSEQLSHQIAIKLGEKLGYEDEQINVLAYGLFSMVQTVFAIGVVIIIGMLFGVVIEAIIISFSIALLRKTSGGVHASSAERCICLGTFISVGGAILCKVFYSALSISELILIVSLVFIWNYYIIYRKAPVDSSRKPIKNIEKREKLKKRSLTVLTTYLIGVIGGMIMYLLMGKQRILLYVLCLVLGTVWQVFTLTEIGDKIVCYLDHLLIYIFSKLKGGKKSEKN